MARKVGVTAAAGQTLAAQVAEAGAQYAPQSVDMVRDQNMRAGIVGRDPREQRRNQWRLRVHYRKDGRLAFLGHLEIVNTINRCVRRAGLPLAVGNGFARRIRLQFSQALPVGAASADEYYDVYLTDRVDEDQALELLQGATPHSLAPIEVTYAPNPQPALESWLDHASWQVDFLEPCDPQVLKRGIEQLQGEGTLCYLRGAKEKHVNLSHCLLSWEVVGEVDALTLKLETATDEAASLRPQILIQKAMESQGLAAPRSLRVTRLSQWHEEGGVRSYAM